MNDGLDGIGWDRYIKEYSCSCMYVCMSLSLMKKKKKELGVGAVTRRCLFVCLFENVGHRWEWVVVHFVVRDGSGLGFCILYFVFVER